MTSAIHNLVASPSFAALLLTIDAAKADQIKRSGK